MGLLLKLLCPVFRSTKEDIDGPEEASSPQDTLIQENSAGNCSSSVTLPSKPSIISDVFKCEFKLGP